MEEVDPLDEFMKEIQTEVRELKRKDDTLVSSTYPKKSKTLLQEEALLVPIPEVPFQIFSSWNISEINELYFKHSE